MTTTVITNSLNERRHFSPNQRPIEATTAQMNKLKTSKIIPFFNFSSELLTETQGELNLLFAFPKEIRPPFYNIKIENLISGEIYEFKAYKDRGVKIKTEISDFKVTLSFEMDGKTTQAEEYIYFNNCLNLKTSKCTFDPFRIYLDRDIEDEQLLFNMLKKGVVKLYYNKTNHQPQYFTEDDLYSIFIFDEDISYNDLRVLDFKYNSFGDNIQFESNKYIQKTDPLSFKADKLSYITLNENNEIYMEILNNKEYLFNFLYSFFSKIMEIIKKEGLLQNDYYFLIKNPLSNYIKGNLNNDIVIKVFDIGQVFNIENTQEVIDQGSIGVSL